VNAAVHRTGIPVDLTINLACSGGASDNLRFGNGARQWDELNQGDNLAIKARNTRIGLIWIIDSANDAGGVEFGPSVTDCTIRRLLFLGECWPDHTDNWQARVNVSGAGLESAIRSVRQTMTEQGHGWCGIVPGGLGSVPTVRRCQSGRSDRPGCRFMITGSDTSPCTLGGLRRSYRMVAYHFW
jgi:hypothetical protein